MFVQSVLLCCSQFSGTLYRAWLDHKLSGKYCVSWAALSRLGQIYFWKWTQKCNQTFFFVNFGLYNQIISSYLDDYFATACIVWRFSLLYVLSECVAFHSCKPAVSLLLSFNSGCLLLGFSLQCGQHLAQNDSMKFKEFCPVSQLNTSTLSHSFYPPLFVIFPKFFLTYPTKIEALLYNVPELIVLLQVKHILIKGLVF